MKKRQPNIILSTVQFSAAILLFIGAFCPAFSQESGNGAVRIEVENKNTSARLFLTAPHAIEATVHFEFDRLQNAEPSTARPLDFIIDRVYAHRELANVRQKLESPWAYHFSYRYKIGIRSALPTIDYVYSLPYSSASHFTVSQANCGTFSHLKGSQSENAVDFRMPEGTPILAARPGVVVAFREDSTLGGRTEDFKEKENFVTVKHNDGTYATYVHLKPNGVLVRVGQAVTVGTKIGLSGSTGWSTEPHLHFEVYRVIDWSKSESLPFNMNTPKGIVKTFKTGETY